ncbi:MAG: EamA family transporter [Dysosmobacter sp.]
MEGAGDGRKKLAGAGTDAGRVRLCAGSFAGGVSVTAAGEAAGNGGQDFFTPYTASSAGTLQARYGSITTTMWTFLFAGFGSLVFLRPGELAAAITTPGTWLTTAGLVVFSTAAPYLLYTWGFPRWESGRAAIMASLGAGGSGPGGC